MADRVRQAQNRAAAQRAGLTPNGVTGAGLTGAGGAEGAAGFAGNRAGYEFGTELAGPATPAAGNANQRARAGGTARVPGARQGRGDNT